MPSPLPPLRRRPRSALTLGLLTCALVAPAAAQPRPIDTPDPVVPMPLAEAAEVITETLERHGFKVTQPRSAELWIELWVEPRPRAFTERPTPPIVPLSVVLYADAPDSTAVNVPGPRGGFALPGRPIPLPPRQTPADRVYELIAAAARNPALGDG